MKNIMSFSYLFFMPFNCKKEYFKIINNHES